MGERLHWIFQRKMRDSLLNVEIFNTILEARVLTETLRRECNQVRPHGVFRCRPPAPEDREPAALVDIGTPYGVTFSKICVDIGG